MVSQLDKMFPLPLPRFMVLTMTRLRSDDAGVEVSFSAHNVTVLAIMPDFSSRFMMLEQVLDSLNRRRNLPPLLADVVLPNWFRRPSKLTMLLPLPLPLRGKDVVGFDAPASDERAADKVNRLVLGLPEADLGEDVTMTLACWCRHRSGQTILRLQ